jgi:hypothetical protein
MDVSEKKFGVSVTFSPKMYEAIDGALSAGSFSSKVENALMEWFALKSLLVQYRSDDQIIAGTPVVLNEFAARVYSCSQFQNGWSFRDTDYGVMILNCLDSLIELIKQPKGSWASKGQKWVRDNAIPAFRRMGLIVQVIDHIEHDLFDVWVCDPKLGEAAKNCGNCPVVQEIWEYVDGLKKRRKI